jgi:hypothetical protein
MSRGVCRRIRCVLTGLILALACAGCSLGPKAIEKSHGRYAESVRLVEQEQLLRQLVLLRYNEISVDLDVSNIADQYELTGGAEARPFFLAPNPSNSNLVFKTFTSILPDVTLGGATRPTVSLTPHSDAAATRRFLTPISLDTLIFLMQTNWPVDTVLRLWVERMNGVPNAATASAPGWDEVPDYERFLRIAELFRDAQRQELAITRVEDRETIVGGPIPAESMSATALVEAAKNGLEYRLVDDKKSWVLVRKEKRLAVEVSPGAGKAPEALELARLLNLDVGLPQYDIVVSNRGIPDPARFPTPPTNQLRVVPRSTAQAAYFLSNGVEVPQEHVCSGIARQNSITEIAQNLFSVHVSDGRKPPPTAFVAIHYRGYWYYIDDRDTVSKNTFALMFHMSHLDFTRDALRGPALTLPIGR